MLKCRLFLECWSATPLSEIYAGHIRRWRVANECFSDPRPSALLGRYVMQIMAPLLTCHYGLDMPVAIASDN